MKNNLINFILKEKINETGIKNSGYTWLELAKKFNIKVGATNTQRRKAANDIWRSYKKKNLLGQERSYNLPDARYITSRHGELHMDVDGEYREDFPIPGRSNQGFYNQKEKRRLENLALTKWFDEEEMKKKKAIATHQTLEDWVETKSDEISDRLMDNLKSQFQDGVYLIMGCVHVPFVNHDFMKAVLKCAETLDVKGLVFNGDFLDLNTLSFYDKGKNPLDGISLGYEYDQGNKMLDVIEAALPKNIDKYFLYGNHEDRFWRHMSTVDFAKLKGAIKSPTDALNLKQRGYKVYEDWANDEVVLGDLTIIHGEFCSIHTAKSHLDTYKKNMLFAHTHRSQMYREGEHVSYNIGSMADFSSKAFNYASKSMKKKWSNGMAIATVVEGKTTVEQITWNKNHFVYGGNVWKI